MSAGNPEKAIDAITATPKTTGSGITVYPLTISRYAILDKVKSPLLTGSPSPAGMLATMYVMTQPVEKLMADSDDISRAAMLWGDQVGVGAVEEIVASITSQLNDLLYLSPGGEDGEDGKKKPRTAG